MNNKPTAKNGEKVLPQQSRNVANGNSFQDPTDIMNTDYPVPPYLWMKQLEMSKRSYLPLRDYQIGQYVKLRAEDWDRILLQVLAGIA